MNVIEKNKRLRFNADDDLSLCREVVSFSPLVNPENWEMVQKNIEATTKKIFSIRTLKDHLHLLLEVWLKKNEVTIIDSGKEEIFSEKDQLLQEIVDVCKEHKISFKKGKTVKSSTEKKISELGKSAREESANVLREWNENSEHIYERTNVVNEEIVVLQDHDYGLSNVSTGRCLTETVLANNDIQHNEWNMQPTSESLAQKKIAFPINESVAGCASAATENTLQNQTNNQCKQNIPTTPARKILGPVRRKQNYSSTMKRSALDYLNTKEERNYKLRQKELDLEDRKLKLQERRMALDEQKWNQESSERQMRLELEKENIKNAAQVQQHTMNLLKSQQKIIDCLLPQIKHNNPNLNTNEASKASNSV